jgi:hypothetical protein
MIGAPNVPWPEACGPDLARRCLGAAVIMQWNTIPAKLQRELFDTADSLGDLPNGYAERPDCPLLA